MAHFAQIDNDNIVRQVLVVSNNDAVSGHDFLTGVLGLTGTWLQTSYNTRGGKHYTSSTYTKQVTSIASTVYSSEIGGLTTIYEPVYSTFSSPPSADGLSGYRYNYAGVGYSYDADRDAFIPPKPAQYPSWVIDESTCFWVPPVAYPDNGYITNTFGITGVRVYSWDESSTNWLPNSAVPTLSSAYYSQITPYPDNGWGIGSLTGARSYSWDALDLQWEPMSGFPTLSAYYFKTLSANP